ncbi:MAG: hypothetical protein ACRCTA_04745 [Bacilli bacterium]
MFCSKNMDEIRNIHHDYNGYWSYYKVLDKYKLMEFKLYVQDYLKHVIFKMSRSENDKKDIENYYHIQKNFQLI